VSLIADRHGVELDAAATALLGDAPGGGCWGMVKAVVLWPFRKVLKTVLFVFLLKGMADVISEVIHRSLLLEEALESGWLPGEAERVRGAMDRALASVDTRVVERLILGTLRDARHELNGVIWETTRIARARMRDRPADALADAAEADALGPGADRMSRAFSAALSAAGLVPELVQWFRAEMGQVPRLEARMPGPIVPELLDADPVPVAQLPGPLVEDAVEVPPGRDDAAGSTPGREE
jgi:hypothetical protein